MSNTKSTLTAERLRMLVNYDRETGLFTRIFRSGTKVKIGDPAGHKHRMGYLAFCIDAKPHLAHRLAWLYVYGSWPTGHIDHINGIKTDNRISNLRDVSCSTNLQNLRHATATNKVGLLGVIPTRSPKRWGAQIRINGRRTHLGYFDSPELAHAAYVEAKRKHHGGCTI